MNSRRVFEEQNLGITLEEALEGMTDRVPNLDLKFFATAVVLQRQTGGDLAEILDKIGHLIRERFKIWGQIQALTGEGRLSGSRAVGFATRAVLCRCMRLNSDYIMLLFRDPMGKKMMLFGIVTQLIGAIVIKKIVKIKCNQARDLLACLQYDYADLPSPSSAHLPPPPGG